MRPRWKLPPQILVPPPFEVEVVLVEYNGPQIVTLHGPDGLYLGVASDEDEEGVRWIYASITRTEFRALLDGAASLRDSLLKPRVYIIDAAHDGNALRSWVCDAAHLDEADLPRRGALLPTAARAEFAASAPEWPELCLDRPDLALQGVFFRALADLLSAFQRLWNAIAQARNLEKPKDRGRWNVELSDRATLALAGAAPGSLILRIKPADPGTYDEIAFSFEELVRAGDSTQALAGQLDSLGQRVQARYGELISNLQRHGLQMFTRRAGGSAFLAAHTAPRILAALPRGVVEKPRSLPATGYFIAFDTRGRSFEFYDEVGEESYSGQVHPEVLARNDAVVVGTGTKYAVLIEVTTYVVQSRQVTQTYTLRTIERSLRE